MKRTRTRMLVGVFRREEQDEVFLLDRMEEEQDETFLPDRMEEEEEALALNNFPKIRRRHRRLTIPPAPDLWQSTQSMTSTMLPPTMPPTLPRRSLIGRFADAVVELARTVTAAFSRSSGYVPPNNTTSPQPNRIPNGATQDEYKYDAAKCVVSSVRTYCRNCQRYHHALVPDV